MLDPAPSRAHASWAVSAIYLDPKLPQIHAFVWNTCIQIWMSVIIVPTNAQTCGAVYDARHSDDSRAHVSRLFPLLSAMKWSTSAKSGACVSTYVERKLDPVKKKKDPLKKALTGNNNKLFAERGASERSHGEAAGLTGLHVCSEVLSDEERDKFINLVKSRKGPTGWTAQSPLYMNPGQLSQPLCTDAGRQCLETHSRPHDVTQSSCTCL
jgi:hypothetical protein